MDSKWAEENLQTIRTLMERSAVYRRALAPIMLCAGTVGIIAAAAGLVFQLNSIHAFLSPADRRLNTRNASGLPPPGGWHKPLPQL